MVALPGGRFRMGSDRHYPEEAPVVWREVAPFRIDRTPVTNRAFAAFVQATGHVTVAERVPDPAQYPGIDPAKLKPGGLVFGVRKGLARPAHWSDWWRFVPGANWRKPEGGPSVFRGRLDHPVVQVAHADALAYAAWVGKDLPTEAEFEYAARGGLDGAVYAWGDQRRPAGRIMANHWTGRFPQAPAGEHGFTGTSPVGSFPPDGNGLSDMIGNVWEWTLDYWLGPHDAPACCSGDPAAKSRDPELPGVQLARRVVKGGSHLCCESYCDRYRPAARQPQMEDTATSHIGFRCVVREA
jgi:formylglycine-generating enzyme